VRREGSRITHVIVENKSGRSALAGATFIDATGDADVCFTSGEETLSLDSNVISGWFYTLTSGALKLHQLSKADSPSADTENAEGPFFRADDAERVTEHILQTRSLVRDRLAEIRANHPQEDTQALMPATMACFRMTRRLVAGFTLTDGHMHQWLDDAIGLTGDWRRPGPVFAIPFRCLQAMRNTNLLVAGRCISVDNTAWDALRAIPPCVVTGEAAGTAAAMAARPPAVSSILTARAVWIVAAPALQARCIVRPGSRRSEQEKYYGQGAQQDGCTRRLIAARDPKRSPDYQNIGLTSLLFTK